MAIKTTILYNLPIEGYFDWGKINTYENSEVYNLSFLLGFPGNRSNDNKGSLTKEFTFSLKSLVFWKSNNNKSDYSVFCTKSNKAASQLA